MRKAKLAALREARQDANTTACIVATQHELDDLVRPNPEGVARLVATCAVAGGIVRQGGDVVFGAFGSRHCDDQAALYDSFGWWLLTQGRVNGNRILPHQVHGEDWLEPGEMVYNGADELRVGARGIARDPSIKEGLYICSPGQAERAERYAKKCGFLGRVVVPEALQHDTEGQFHDNARLQKALKILSYFDPGDRILRFMTQRERIPADGLGPESLPALIPGFAAAGLTWHQNQTPAQ